MTDGVGQGVVGTTVRLSVAGPAGRCDLVAPEWARVGDVAERYAERLGLAAPPELTTPAGRVLAASAPLDDAGLRHGSLLLVTRTDPAGEDPSTDGAGPGRGAAAEAPAPWAYAASAAAALLAGPVAVLGDLTPGLRTATALALGLAALVATLPVGSPAARLRRLHALPCFLGSAGVVLTSDAPTVLLPVAVGGLGALVGAGIARALAEAEDPVAWVWLVAAAPVTAVAAALLGAGTGPDPLWALGATLGVLVARGLPALVVDVPDDTLLDVSTMADTAWSAREERSPGRSGRLVRRSLVDGVVGHAGVLLRAGTIACVVVVVPAALLLLGGAEPERWWRGAAAEVTVGAAGAGLALAARAYRDWRLGTLLRVTAAVLVAAVAVSVLGGASVGVQAGVVAGTVLLGAAVVRAALALGQGWRSVWWARMADLAQGLCFVLVLGLLPVTTGLFDRVWGFAA